jgi:hypothetical protein
VAGREVAGVRIVTERELAKLRIPKPRDLDVDDQEAETLRSCRRIPDAIEPGERASSPTR